MKYARNPNLSAVRITDGVVFAPDKDGLLTLANTTYFIELGSTDAPMCEEVVDLSVHLKWSAALAGAITFEWTNFPATRGNQSQQGAVDVATNDSAGTGFWLADPLTSGINAATAIGAGNAFTAPTLTAGGTNAGAWGIQLADRSARRYRLKLVLTAGGTLRVVAHGKLGA